MFCHILLAESGMKIPWWTNGTFSSNCKSLKKTCDPFITIRSFSRGFSQVKKTKKKIFLYYFFKTSPFPISNCKRLLSFGLKSINLNLILPIVNVRRATRVPFGSAETSTVIGKLDPPELTIRRRHSSPDGKSRSRWTSKTCRRTSCNANRTKRSRWSRFEAARVETMRVSESNPTFLCTNSTLNLGQNFEF